MHYRRSSLVERLVETANEQVDILDVCRWVGMRVPYEVPRSLKVRCPFGELAHTDHGVAPAFRIYPDTNSSFCFACGFFSPVWLAASVWGMTRREAATALLDRIGYKPVSLAQLWANVVAAPEPPPDTTYLGLALRTYCDRIDTEWCRRQFETRTAHTLDRCLALLSHVRTSEQARLWLTHSKLIMSRVMAGGELARGDEQARGAERCAATGGVGDLS